MYKREGENVSVAINLSVAHEIAFANTHYYKRPTAELYLDRILQYHDIVYLLKGQWLFAEGGRDYLLAKDDVLLLSAGRHHYTRLPCLPNTRTICIHVTMEKGDLCDDKDNLILPTLQNAGNSPAVKEYFSEIVSVYWSNHSHKKERMSALFNLLMLELSDIPNKGDHKAHDLTNEIIQLINTMPHENFRVAEIAERFGVSEKTIQTKMQQGLGTTFSRYQMSRKLEMVARQIEIEPNIRLTDIASIFGFCDEFHMSRCFKKKYGISPAEHRKRACSI